jgi:two-component system, OmpR family, lantibiotic biosynthesis sensor histidine kinase NisK/SpaK
MQNEKINPANYYEGQLPKLVQFVNEQKDVLNVDMKGVLEREIPIEGIDYQIVNREGTVLYGTMQKTYATSETDLVNSLNTNLYDRDRIVIYYPLFDESGTLNGAIGFRYKLSVLSSNHKAQFMLYGFVGLAFLSPFLYFYLFSYLIGKRLSRKMEGPFHAIIESANKIRNHDLNFSLSNVENTEELNQLVFAFEEMKNALKESLEKQWRLEQDRKDMVAAIAHDLKTPLTIIQGHVEGLLERKNQPQDRIERYLHTIQRSCIRSIQLIKELNEVSTVDHAGFTLHFTKGNLAKWVEQKASQFHLLCEEKGIEFNVKVNKVDKLINPFVLIDFERVDQVIDNVFMNSLRFTPTGGMIKWVTTFKKPYIIFEILDNGPGFSSKCKEKVFEKFYREDPSRSGDSGHSGLGLYIAQTIAKKHGGEIIASNREEGGAYVNIVIKIGVSNTKNRVM